jgi:multidrug efflux system membrane fusion protein
MKKSVFIALAIAIIAIVWMGFGVLTHEEADMPPSLAQQRADDTSSGETKIPEVRVKTMMAESYVQQLDINGRTQAGKKVELTAEISGRVIEFLYDEGDSVEEGAIIARIDAKDRAERVKEAERILTQRQIEYDAAKSLENRGFNSKISLAGAASALESAKANLKLAQDELKKTTIVASFGGVLSQKMVEIGDFISIGEPIITLAQLDPLEVTGFVTERNIRDIQKGTSADISIRGRSIGQGIVTYTSSVAEDVSRTFEIEIEIPNPNLTLIDGLTVEISIPLKSRLAYKISPSVLTLGPKGEIGVKLVNDENIVEFHAIEMLSDAASFSWVSGLPDSIRLITLGQNFVSVGTTVKPVEHDEAAEENIENDTGSEALK